MCAPWKTGLALLLPILIKTRTMTHAEPINWSALSPLPDQLGFAGMYAGVSNGAVVAMGGANFPDKYPWEGGQKKWYDSIYVLPPDGNWIHLDEKLADASGYGVSVSYQNKLIAVGGCSEKELLSSVGCYEWSNGRLKKDPLPSLPHPLAYMTGAVLGNALLILGGARNLAGAPTKTALLLDLQAAEKGWQPLKPWPGPERTLPVCGVWNDQLFLMGGTTSCVTSAGQKYQHTLLDNYSLTLTKTRRGWSASWKTLVPIPRGVSAAGTLPLVSNSRFVIWGGVDAVTAQFRTPQNHPGLTRSVLFYYPDSDSWEYWGEQHTYPSRVTLPVIPYQNGWLYVSGEVKPGIRTPSIIKLNS
ncbi:hypothetical protein ACFPMF_19355 [Larkinella bovis]|uniref:Galactose oxidase n=1 Tax=Larkinella bovis TaxID=683041 RepID=A0ABW0IDX9_9BACT